MLNEKQKALSKKFVDIGNKLRIEEMDTHHLHALYMHAGFLKDFILLDNKYAMSKFVVLLKKLSVLSDDELLVQIAIINRFLIAISDSDRYTVISYPKVNSSIVIEVLDNESDIVIYTINLEIIDALH